MVFTKITFSKAVRKIEIHISQVKLLCRLYDQQNGNVTEMLKLLIIL